MTGKIDKISSKESQLHKKQILGDERVWKRGRDENMLAILERRAGRVSVFNIFLSWNVPMESRWVLRLIYWRLRLTYQICFLNWRERHSPGSIFAAR